MDRHLDPSDLGTLASAGFLSQSDSRDRRDDEPYLGGPEVMEGRLQSSQRDFHCRPHEWTQSDHHRHHPEN